MKVLFRGGPMGWDFTGREFKPLPIYSYSGHVLLLEGKAIIHPPDI